MLESAMSQPSALRRSIARIWRRLRGERRSPARVAAAVATGLFIGVLPLYGLHFLLCLLVCLPLELDFVATYLAANISNPFVAPFLITLEVEVGSLITTGQHAAFTLARAKQTGILGFAWQAGVGSVFVGLAFAAIGGSTAYVVARGRKRVPLSRDSSSSVDDSADEQCEAALLRTIERYRRAPIGDRLYVAGKLRSDPVTRMLVALPGELGRVLDAGAGRGQFGLLLVELGRARELVGFDGDARKIGVFRDAAASAARVEVRDLLELPELEADTVLLIDVLHYLPQTEQSELLSQVAARVPQRGARILIRELDAVPGARSMLTRIGERLATLSGYNRGRAAHHYRRASELVSELTQCGFACEVLGASEGTPFGNVLIVATRT
jgi:uncharacterized protein (DUF2062 family)/SAM-dependent methyltransferase